MKEISTAKDSHPPEESGESSFVGSHVEDIWSSTPSAPAIPESEPQGIPLTGRWASFPQIGMTRMAAALGAFGLVAATSWTLTSGFHRLPQEIFTSRQNVELSLPYRGVCRGLTVTAGGKEIPTIYKDIKAGLARFSLPLTPGTHQVEVRFETLIPGWERNYSLEIVVDQTPPALTFADHPLLRTPTSSTIQEELVFEGQSEARARVYVGETEIDVDKDGHFSEKLDLERGWNHLLVRVEDRAGNRTARKLSIFRDVSAPEITWRTAPDQSFSDPAARLELEIVDDGPLGALSGQVDGQVVAWHRKPDNRWLGVTPALADGRHEVDLKVADQAGRVSTSKRNILVDSSEMLGETDLCLGARGADIIELHRRLTGAGFLPETIGSIFNNETKKALEALQESEGIPVTGRADHQTLVALGPRVYVNLREFSLILERPGQPDRRWNIASGASEFPTPAGRFVVYEKVQEPTWLPPKSDWAKDAKPVEAGPDNPLGSRWIGLDWGGIGIHGTNAPWTVGSAASHGCIRMETSQVEELFSLVEVGTPVVILDGSEDDPLIDKFWPKS